MGRWQLDAGPPPWCSAYPLPGEAGKVEKFTLRAPDVGLGEGLDDPRVEPDLLPVCPGRFQAGKGQGVAACRCEQVKERLPRVWQGGIEVHETADPLRHACCNPGDDHPAVTVPGEDDAPEIVFCDDGADLGDVPAQIRRVLIAQCRCERPVPVGCQEPDGPIPAPATEVPSGRIVAPAAQPVPCVRGDAAALHKDAGCFQTAVLATFSHRTSLLLPGAGGSVPPGQEFPGGDRRRAPSSASPRVPGRVIFPDL